MLAGRILYLQEQKFGIIASKGRLLCKTKMVDRSNKMYNDKYKSL